MPAIPVVVGVVGIFAALVALIILVAYPQLLRPLIVAGLSQVPLVGGWLVRNVDSVTMRAYAQASAWALVALSPWTDLLRRLRVAWFLWSDKMVHALVQTTLAIWGLRYQWLPWVQAQATAYSNQVYAWSVAFTVSVYARAVQYADALHAQETAFAQQVYAWSVAFTTSVYARAVQYADALHAQETAYAQALEGQAIQYARDLQAQETAYAQALQAQALGFARDAFGRSIEFERQLFGEATGYAERLAAQDRDYAQRIGAQAEAYAFALAVPITAAVTALERSPCIRYCDPLGGLGKGLQELADLGVAAALVALAVETLHDPQAASKDFQEVFTPLSRTAGDLARSTLGV